MFRRPSVALGKAWLPAVCWAALIFSMSTDSFSAEHTGQILRPILFWLIPNLTNHAIRTIHHFMRKCAHFTEYFIFCMLLFRGLRGRKAGVALAVGAYGTVDRGGLRILDEVHQSFVASRTASPYDSLLDSVGAGVAMIALWMWFRRRSRVPVT